MRNSKKILLGYWFLSLVILTHTSSCIDSLDFFSETDEGQIIIYGLFTDLDEVQVVNVSKTVSMGLIPIGVTNAQVTLLTEEGERFIYLNAGNGNYELQGIKGMENKSYAIEVLADGKVYRSSYEKIPSLIAEDSLSFTFTFEPLRNEIPEQVFTLSAYTEIPSSSEPIYLRWQTEETHLWMRTVFPCSGLCPPPPPNCFIYDFLEPSRLNLFDGLTSNTRVLNQVMGRRNVDNSFFFPFFFSVTQLSINREAYEYWEKVKIMVNNEGSLFDIPPAPIFGNISNVDDGNERVFGYFEVGRAKITRIYTTRQDVPFFMPEPCKYNPEIPRDAYPPACLNCAIRAGSRKWDEGGPEWWVFD
ncbi:DUF4249 domain-containing protein [Pararhodonellum marinum]|uniref:DUF4249 domain-containing protein n=1 Tax=Pararhodonellum marinum TaxID=2755358 RepID=UPI00188E4BD8|nr:DUF4249 domain-containing protein [Pararhodonellum marinum]